MKAASPERFRNIISTALSQDPSEFHRILIAQGRKTATYHVIKSYTSDFKTELGISPLETVWVSPQRITKHSPTSFDRRKNVGEIRGGNWDKSNLNDESKRWLGLPIEEHPLYKAMESHFDDGTDWWSTTFVNRQIEKVENGEIAWYGRCNDISGIRSQCQYLDELYSAIRTEGFKKQSEIDENNLIIPDAYHNITVNIDREGELLFAGDGRHRLFLSKIIGIDEVPVRTLVIHREVVNSVTNVDSLSELIQHI